MGFPWCSSHFTAKHTGSIPGRVTKVPQTPKHSQKKKKKKGKIDLKKKSVFIRILSTALGGTRNLFFDDRMFLDRYIWSE